jgi:hypothetical protein
MKKNEILKRPLLLLNIHLKQELDKTKKLSYIFKIAIVLCLSLFSFMIGYMIIQLMRDKGTV